ncbi:MAG: mobilization protein [Bacteroidales bacterium]|nr:mobilization protein [Bacteroidales bacterium]
MGFVVLHMEKAHGSDSGTTAHIERFIIPKNADPTRTHLNQKLITYPDGIKDRSAAIQRRLEEAGLTRKIGNNQVRAIRINVSGTHEDMERIEKEGRLDEWCADDIMTRLKLKSYQDSYAVAMAKYGLQRGIGGSKARHKSTTQYYRDTQRLADSLKAEVVDLQQQKETAQEELKQAKKEVQTEKLKGAATTAATNIAESVGSLFGGGKMKALEHRNEDLQDRILELEEEARQSEHQQAKQIQEIKNAYEQQNSKLSEFVDFVKRYFPYVEKLMPTIKFLRDTLNFGDAVIRKLCAFKNVSIKGELYSREFNQHFRADKTICSLKEDKDGNFNLNMDGVSHVSWFRRKKDEFMQALGMPTRKQNRGIKI